MTIIGPLAIEALKVMDVSIDATVQATVSVWYGYGMKSILISAATDIAPVIH